MDGILVIFENQVEDLNPVAVSCLGTAMILVLISLLCLCRQPQSPGRQSFQVPLVPLTPMLSVAINAYLMMKLPSPTWVRFSVWMAVGLFIYATYGVFNSTGFMSEQQKQNHMEAKVIFRSSSLNHHHHHHQPEKVIDVSSVH